MFSYPKTVKLKKTRDRMWFLVDSFLSKYPQFSDGVTESSAKGIEVYGDKESFPIPVLKIIIRNEIIKEIRYLSPNSNEPIGKWITINFSNNFNIVRTSLHFTNTDRTYAKCEGVTTMESYSNNRLTKHFSLRRDANGNDQRYVRVLNYQTFKNRKRYTETYVAHNKGFTVKTPKNTMFHNNFDGESRFLYKLSNPEVELIPQHILDSLIRKNQFRHAI